MSLKHAEAGRVTGARAWCNPAIGTKPRLARPAIKRIRGDQ